MDDYNVNVLSEAKNEYSSRLMTILTPLIIEGIKSIFNEATQLCTDNDEDEKYLMTFQNFLTRVPKWNSTIIEEETSRILKTSGCTYLEDLLTCVHITQLKILTAIRVSNVQKKIDIDIPKLSNFIHKIYISFARKLYSNIYLFEKNIMPLQYQKNMRECEVLVQECILNTIRDNMPVENILRAYMDETVNEEVIEEVIEKAVSQKEEENIEKKIEETDNNNNMEIVKTDKPLLVNKESSDEDWKPNPPIDTKQVKENVEEENPKDNNEDDKQEKNNISLKVKERVPLSFNDNDSVLDLGTNKESIVQAPKTDERLDKIAKEQNEKRKAEEALEDDEEEKIKIFDSVDLQLDNLDINNLEKKIDTRPDPILNDIEVLG
uniref:Uncharacterized protein n=1 Tax=viral metagenome TaxID=1070528 RepID=A0A6C0C4S0_9ZZZZ